MRLSAPRIAPVDLEKIDDEQREALAPMEEASKDVTRTGGHILNIFRTLVHAPKALTAFLAWGGYILSRRNSLSERDRELVILRVGYNCGSGYEFTQHTRIGLDAGLTEAEVEAIKAGPDR
jgi:alkylhydroperoxidase family enzyme